MLATCKVFGRHASIRDVAIDTAGVIIGVAVVQSYTDLFIEEFGIVNRWILIKYTRLL